MKSMEIIYNGIKIIEKNGKFYLTAPTNGTQRIFNSLEVAKNYINNAEAMDSYAKAMTRNP